MLMLDSSDLSLFNFKYHSLEGVSLLGGDHKSQCHVVPSCEWVHSSGEGCKNALLMFVHQLIVSEAKGN